MIKFFLNRIDWNLILIIFFLIILGLINLFSISQTLFLKQLIFSIIFFIVLFLVSLLDWRFLINQKIFLYGFYLLNLLLLFLTLFQKEIKGAKNWLIFGPLNFQPVELMKLAIIFILADFFSKKYFLVWFKKNIFKSFIYILLPSLIIAFQPDFGSIVAILFIWLSFLMLSGINFKRLIFFILIGALIFVILWEFYFLPYQKNRIIAFLFPNYDPLGVNYNVIQAKIAIGSAGLFGKGFQNGSQVKLGFLPEAHTDFAFAAIVEQFGFVIGLIIFLFYLILFYRLLKIGSKADDNLFKFLILGFVLNLFVNTFLNIGSNLGVLPVTGLGLPFISYGGSYLLTLAIMFGIIQRINLEF